MIQVVEDEKFRLARVRVKEPWPGNPYEDYEFASNTLNVGDSVVIEWSYDAPKIPAIQLVPGLPTAEDLDTVAKEREVASETDLPF